MKIKIETNVAIHIFNTASFEETFDICRKYADCSELKSIDIALSGVPVTYDPDEHCLVTTNEVVAEFCEAQGLEALPCIDENLIQFYWMIFEKGGIDKYFDKIYADDPGTVLIDEELPELPF